MTVYNYLQYDFSGDSDPLAAKSWMKYLTPLQHELQSRVYVKLHHWKTNIINKGNHTHPSWSHSQIKLSMKPLGATDPERLVRVPIIRVFHHPVRLPGRPFYRPCFPPVWFEHQVLSTIPVRAIHFPPTRPFPGRSSLLPPPFVLLRGRVHGLLFVFLSVRISATPVRVPGQSCSQAPPFVNVSYFPPSLSSSARARQHTAGSWARRSFPPAPDLHTHHQLKEHWVRQGDTPHASPQPLPPTPAFPAPARPRLGALETLSGSATCPGPEAAHRRPSFSSFSL